MHQSAAVTPAPGYVYSRAPRMIYWEMTRACDLACRHCRAEAIAARDPLELSTVEARELLEQIADFGPPLPHVVFTGGDPLKRADLLELVGYGTQRGLAISLAPSATGALTHDSLAELVTAGVESISLSLDGATPATHDGFRGVPGTFAQTLAAAQWVRELHVPLQLNTLVTADNAGELPALYRLAQSMDLMRWSLFFLVTMGRGRALRELSPADAESVMEWVYAISSEAPFAVAATEAPHFRRVALVRMRAAGLAGDQIRNTPIGRGFGIRDGNGVMFISHRGEVAPAGFLPVVTGNVRNTSVVDLYCLHHVFTSLRDVRQLRGKCGRCEYRSICGGSRARAYAHTGDYLASDPLCVYEP